ncbi:diguanylate cyclase (GGDEF)-like protein [Ruminiclostridium sufflavum DSM 19573]|uniref:Diguanylate cyclase (GGDEF)-like protein n=1 Tax=Ruminiclostridium sufflavum DSM 19573 TaxID=1121337 RepID=A0A318XP34_9FIRM|nr:bifunctional diguanylate cyclase/phosphodiesterase [Ruminiclostridium sufflavum]PYG89925.1 diguanylate cyclase (GGDEF)-like protein [Ruminiclostridium sufflavum DSM 19573]
MKIKNNLKLFIAVITISILAAMIYLSVSQIRQQGNNYSINSDQVFDMGVTKGEADNKPVSVFEAFKPHSLSILIFAVFLITLLILIKYINKMKNMGNWLSNCSKELREYKSRYAYIYLHDVLTGLPNRKALLNDAGVIFSEKETRTAALIYIDMDNFKYINDTLGHEFGDDLIKQASERLLHIINGKGTLYRLGGDEFVILTAVDKSEAEGFLENIIAGFKDELVINGETVHISLSIGVAMYPEHGDNINSLLKAADIAMYKAKENGKSIYSEYNNSMNAAFSERMNIEKYLHTAMKRDEFELYFQPQLDLSSNKVIGLEALVRWKSPELGNVSPMKFIKVAEDTHMIIPLGEWVLIQACDYLSHLFKSGYPKMVMSVNISSIQILQEDFTDRVTEILKCFNIEPRYLELEITETRLIEAFDTVYNKLRLLSDMGIRIALDDFGKGYSSLNYLNQLPIHTLKIDKCFIDNVSLENEKTVVTKHIISMGKDMGLSIVAEGVEMQEQLEYLKKYRCDKMQGYIFSRPLPKSELEKLLKSMNSDKFKAVPRGA